MSKIEILRPINTIDYMDYKPIEAAEIASRYGEYIAKAAHYSYQADQEQNPITKEHLQKLAENNLMIAYQYGNLLGHASDETESRVNGAIRAIERAFDAGKPYRLPYGDEAYYPGGTSILLHWSEK